MENIFKHLTIILTEAKEERKTSSENERNMLPWDAKWAFANMEMSNMGSGQKGFDKFSNDLINAYIDLRGKGYSGEQAVNTLSNSIGKYKDITQQLDAKFADYKNNGKISYAWPEESVDQLRSVVSDTKDAKSIIPTKFSEGTLTDKGFAIINFFSRILKGEPRKDIPEEASIIKSISDSQRQYIKNALSDYFIHASKNLFKDTLFGRGTKDAHDSNQKLKDASKQLIGKDPQIEEFVEKGVQKALDKIDQYDISRGNFGAWVFTTVKNSIIDEFKKFTDYSKIVGIDKVTGQNARDFFINNGWNTWTSLINPEDLNDYSKSIIKNTKDNEDGSFTYTFEDPSYAYQDYEDSATDHAKRKSGGYYVFDDLSKKSLDLLKANQLIKSTRKDVGYEENNSEQPEVELNKKKTTKNLSPDKIKSYSEIGQLFDSEYKFGRFSALKKTPHYNFILGLALSEYLGYFDMQPVWNQNTTFTNPITGKEMKIKSGDPVNKEFLNADGVVSKDYEDALNNFYKETLSTDISRTGGGFNPTEETRDEINNLISNHIGDTEFNLNKDQFNEISQAATKFKNKELDFSPLEIDTLRNNMKKVMRFNESKKLKGWNFLFEESHNKINSLLTKLDSLLFEAYLKTEKRPGLDEKFDYIFGEKYTSDKTSPMLKFITSKTGEDYYYLIDRLVDKYKDPTHSGEKKEIYNTLAQSLYMGAFAPGVISKMLFGLGLDSKKDSDDYAMAMDVASQVLLGQKVSKQGKYKGIEKLHASLDSYDNSSNKGFASYLGNQNSVVLKAIKDEVANTAFKKINQKDAGNKGMSKGEDEGDFGTSGEREFSDAGDVDIFDLDDYQMGQLEKLGITDEELIKDFLHSYRSKETPEELETSYDKIGEDGEKMRKLYSSFIKVMNLQGESSSNDLRDLFVKILRDSMKRAGIALFFNDEVDYRSKNPSDKLFYTKLLDTVGQFKKYDLLPYLQRGIFQSVVGEFFKSHPTLDYDKLKESLKIIGNGAQSVVVGIKDQDAYNEIIKELESMGEKDIINILNFVTSVRDTDTYDNETIEKILGGKFSDISKYIKSTTYKTIDSLYRKKGMELLNIKKPDAIFSDLWKGLIKRKINKSLTEDYEFSNELITETFEEWISKYPL